jgi:hypothetical protein
MTEMTSAGRSTCSRDRASPDADNRAIADKIEPPVRRGIFLTQVNDFRPIAYDGFQKHDFHQRVNDD